MKKILLLAYTNLNFGDDMFVYTICKEFPNQSFVLKASSLYSKTLDSIPNLIIRKKGLIERVYDKVVNKVPCLNIINLKTIGYCAVVYVIGGLFDDDEIWERSVDEYGIKKMKNMLWKNSFNKKKPFFLLGCNLTRVTREKYIDEMKYVFEGLTDICFRDKYSYKYFTQLKNTRYAPDIVFNYKCNCVKKDDSILISVWGPLTCVEKFPQWKWAENLWVNYERFLCDVIFRFANLGKNITLLALCENEGDLKACLRIKEKLNFDVDIVTYNGDLDKIILLFEKSRFVIGTRFHSIVMAINAMCSIYPIIYESKTQQLLEDIGYNGSFSHIQMMEGYNINNVIESYNKNEIISCEKIKHKASDQFMKLREYLEG